MNIKLKFQGQLERQFTIACCIYR